MNGAEVWKEFVDPSNQKRYYYNTVTAETTWTNPFVVVEQKTQPKPQVVVVEQESPPSYNTLETPTTPTTTEKNEPQFDIRIEPTTPLSIEKRIDQAMERELKMNQILTSILEKLEGKA